MKFSVGDLVEFKTDVFGKVLGVVHQHPTHGFVKVSYRANDFTYTANVSADQLTFKGYIQTEIEKIAQYLVSPGTVANGFKPEKINSNEVKIALESLEFLVTERNKLYD